MSLATKAHIGRLRSNLTVSAILRSFDYDKWESVTVQSTDSNEYKASSPFADDSSPSFTFNEKKKCYYCFSTSQGGDVFHLISRLLDGQGGDDPEVILETAEAITGLTSERRKSNSVNRASFDDYCSFFEEYLNSPKRDILTGQLKTFHEGQWTSADDRLDVLKAEAHLNPELNISKGAIQDVLAKYRDSLEPSLLVDLPDWDGRDRIKEICQYLSPKNCGQAHVEEYIKAWGADMFRRLENPRHQNKILILKGGQGLGKDMLINSLIGGLQHYADNLTITNDETDMKVGCSELLVVKISEFDRTNKAHPALIKELITADTFYLRKKFGRTHKRVSARSSFIASSNTDDFLRDHTGNRRYVIIDLEGINWAYPSDQSSQILAQMRQLASAKYKISEEAQAVMDQYIEQVTPPDLDEEIVQMFDERAFNIARNNPGHNGKFTNTQVSGLLKEIGDVLGVTPKRVRSVLKRFGRDWRTSTTRGYKLPESHLPKTEYGSATPIAFGGSNDEVSSDYEPPSQH